MWANFCLSFNKEKLLDENSALQDFGIRNNSQVWLSAIDFQEKFVQYLVSNLPAKDFVSEFLLFIAKA